MQSLWVAVALLVVASCGASTSSQRQCPDAPEHCLAGLDCAYDRTRGCEVCRCASPAYTPIEHDPPAGPPE